MNAANESARLLARGGPLLLDFDGPVCSIFAGYPAPTIAGELVDVIRRHGVAVPASVANEDDPLEVLRWTGNGTPDLTATVEAALCAAELRAVERAEPTPFGREVVVGARQIGLSVAIVSNNSPGAVTAYLTAHRLAGHVEPVVGRAYAQPDQMKPSPEPILRAVDSLHAGPGECVLIGDSLSDIDGARAAGMPVIGYANKPAKVDQFAAAGADVVITTMREVADAILSLAAM